MTARTTGKKSPRATVSGRPGRSGKNPGTSSAPAPGRTPGSSSGTSSAASSGKGQGTSSGRAPGRAPGKAPRKAGAGAKGRERPAAQGRGWAGRLVPAGASALTQHVKVLFAVLIWLTLLRQQASLIADWRLYYAQALVAVFALVVGTLVVVYMYPPRTARWRTVAWTFMVSSFSGALAFAALGGRAGLLGALLGGALVLWARAEERGRRAVRRLRRARPSRRT